MEFRIGDRVKCIVDRSAYFITNDLADLVVREINTENNTILVKVLGHRGIDMEDEIGCSFWGMAEDFERYQQFKGNKHATTN